MEKFNIHKWRKNNLYNEKIISDTEVIQLLSEIYVLNNPSKQLNEGFWDTAKNKIKSTFNKKAIGEIKDLIGVLRKAGITDFKRALQNTAELLKSLKGLSASELSLVLNSPSSNITEQIGDVTDLGETSDEREFVEALIKKQQDTQKQTIIKWVGEDQDTPLRYQTEILPVINDDESIKNSVNTGLKKGKTYTFIPGMKINAPFDGATISDFFIIKNLPSGLGKAKKAKDDFDEKEPKLKKLGKSFIALVLLAQITLGIFAPSLNLLGAENANTLPQEETVELIKQYEQDSGTNITYEPPPDGNGPDGIGKPDITPDNMSKILTKNGGNAEINDVLNTTDGETTVVYTWDSKGESNESPIDKVQEGANEASKIINDLYAVCKGDYMKKTDPPQCMPDQYKSKSYVQAYQNFYLGEKKHFAKYTNRDVPKFMQ